MTKPMNPEILALKQVHAILCKFDVKEQRRMMEWLIARLNDDAKAPKPWANYAPLGA